MYLRNVFLWKPKNFALGVKVDLGSYESSRLFLEWADLQRGAQGHARGQMPLLIVPWGSPDPWLEGHLLENSLLIKTSRR